jgi:hypothetical protein
MFAFAFGVRSVNKEGNWEYLYSKPFTNFQETEALQSFTNIIKDNYKYNGGNEVIQVFCPKKLGKILIDKSHSDIAEQCQLMNDKKNVFLIMLATNEATQSIEEVYFKFYLLSLEKIQISSVNMTNMLSMLPD